MLAKHTPSMDIEWELHPEQKKNTSYFKSWQNDTKEQMAGLMNSGQIIYMLI